MTDGDTNMDDADNAVSFGQCEVTECTNAAVHKINRYSENRMSREIVHIDTHLCCDGHYDALRRWAEKREYHGLETLNEVGADA